MSTLNSRCILTVLLFSSLLGADGYFDAIHNECHYSTSDLHDLEYIYRHIFNKKEYARYNSTMNKYEGFTEHGVYNAELWNQDAAELQRRYSQLDAVCRPNAKLSFEAIFGQTCLCQYLIRQYLIQSINSRSVASQWVQLKKAPLEGHVGYAQYNFFTDAYHFIVKPTIRIKSAIHGSLKHTSMLVCSAYDFFPRGIKLTWLRDEKVVQSDVTSTEELANGNWFYQVHSYLEYTPRAGEKISCKVEHASFQKPEVVEWEPNMSEVKRNKVIIGASGLVLGLIITIAGVIYYKKKSTGRILVPSN